MRRVSEKEKAAEAAADDAGIAALAKQAMQDDPDLRESVRRYEEAVVRLEKAKAASEELDRMFAEASKGAVAMDARAEEEERQRNNEKLAEAEVAAAEMRLKAAQLEADRAKQDQLRWQGELTQGADRVDSIKAAAVAAAAGLAAELPLATLTGGGAEGSGLSSTLSLLSAVAACFLFGVTYRYAVRTDAFNKQLRSGVVAAFALVRASGAADVLQAGAAGAEGGPLSLAVVGPAALYALESVIIFGFASVALEAAFGAGIVKRFDVSS